MNETTDLEEQLTNALQARGATASPPTEAWDRIVAALSEDAIRVADDSDDTPEFQILPDEERGLRSIGRKELLLLAAAAIVLLAGLYVALRSTSDDSAPVFIDEPELIEEPSPTPPPSTPRLTQDIPADVESGTITTPVGEARWVHLSGDTSTLPAGEAIPWPSGFAIFEPPYITQDSQFGPVEILSPAHFWLSADGINWQIDESIPVPDDAHDAQLSLDNGQYWLVTSGPRLWHSADAVAWDEIELGGLVPDGPSGLVWSIDLRAPVSVDAVSLALLTFEGEFPFDDFIDAPDELICDPHRELRRVEGNVYTILDRPDEVCPERHLRFVEVATGLDVLDDATGEQLGEIEGADLSDIDRLTELRLIEERILVIQDDRTTSSVPPWSSEYGRAPLRAGDNKVLAFVQPPQDGIATVWQSSDGTNWTDLGPPDFLANLEPGKDVFFTQVTGGPLVARRGDGKWETTDGLTWNPAPGGLPDSPPPIAGVPGGTTAIRLASGWFANAGSIGGPTGGDGWWTYLGDQWFSLDDIGIDDAGGDVRSTSIGDTTIFYTADRNLSGESRSMWIMSNEPD